MPHTPLPWTVEYFAAHGTYDVSHGPPDDPSERYSVLETLTKDDAEFIVRAVNAHDDLLKACEAIDKLDWCGGYEMTQHDELQTALDLARAALAKARGTK